MTDLDKIIDKVLWGDIRSVADQIPIISNLFIYATDLCRGGLYPNLVD